MLRGAFFMTNLLAAAEPVRAQHVLPAPAGEGRLAMIDPRDLGAAGAAVLVGGDHAGRVYDLTGPEALSYREIAKPIADATGTPVEYVDVPPVAARESLVAMRAPDWLVDHLDGVFANVRANVYATTTDTVEELTGRRPRDLATFIAEHADAFAAVGQPA
jgi:uncharacterized protein YbjT (DUF2867 family)